MKDLIKNKYFYIGLIVSALAILGITTITYKLLDTVEPSIDNFVDKEYIVKSLKYTDEIEQICKQDPDAEFLLVALVGSNIEIITKIDSYNKWTVGYRDGITDKVKLTLMRGSFQLALTRLPKAEKEKMI